MPISGPGISVAQCIVNTGRFYQILCVRQFPVVQVHIPLRLRDVRMAQHPAGVLNCTFNVMTRSAGFLFVPVLPREATIVLISSVVLFRGFDDRQDCRADHALTAVVSGLLRLQGE